MHMHNQDGTIAWGKGEKAVDIHMVIPVERCTGCGEEFTGPEAETIQHEAICRHMGVLAPSEIRAIREDAGYSRSAFAQLTGLGESSLQRWEDGDEVQQPAIDRLLRLLRGIASGRG